MARVLVVHHRQHPIAGAVALGASFPLAADEAAGPVLAHAGLLRQFPVVDVLATSVAADVGDPAFVVVARGDAGVAVLAAVLLTGVHELFEVGILGFGGGRHAIVLVGLVGRERVKGGDWWRWVAVSLEVIHRAGEVSGHLVSSTLDSKLESLMVVSVSNLVMFGGWRTDVAALPKCYD